MRLIKELVWGKSNLFNSIIGLGVVCAIALGCNCSKDFGNMGKSDNSNSTVSNSNTTSTPDKKTDTDSDSTSLSDTPRGDVPSERDMEDLTQETLLDFNDAVQSGDFTDFHSKISSVWKSSSSPEKFNEGFKQFIEKKVDISDIKGKTATYDPQPTVTTKGKYKVLSATGKYDTYPLPVRFETEYIKEGGTWKLISIRVDTRK